MSKKQATPPAEHDLAPLYALGVSPDVIEQAKARGIDGARLRKLIQLILQGILGSGILDGGTAQPPPGEDR